MISKMISKKKNRKKVLKKTSRYKMTLQLESVNWDKVEKIFINDRKYIVNFLNKKEENIPHTGEILKLLSGGAVIALSFLIPALPMALAPFIVDSNKYHRGQFNQAIKRLKKQKLVEIVEEKGQTLV
ncbi:hypothetical protein HY945_04545, partial [Candidatus Gottesmanbacteria bacterium]|nr:hypothetical protein [Candidatus Gottesmanbacteria bacterium]